MHASSAFRIARVAEEFARWRGVSDKRRSDAPGWWWGPALAIQNDPAPLPHEVAARLGLPPGARYADAAALILGHFEGQDYQPWPSNFPEKHVPRDEDPAASAEPAAQAEAAAVVPIA
jgi:hypothetical protein